MRKSGILLPVSSLPSKYGIGCFSKEAYKFIDRLKEAGQAYWQILPLGPTSYGDSPYQSFSTFAGNPYFIDPEDLVARGYVTAEQCNAYDFGTDIHSVDYGKIYKSRFRLLKEAFDNSHIEEDARFQEFVQKNAYWLEDYALYMAVKDGFRGICWAAWEDDIKLRTPAAMDKYRRKYAREIAFYQFQQYLFQVQWEKLKTYANDNGIKIIGDIPIYVAFDSSDAWANPELFQFDEDCEPVSVAGCPPDAFLPPDSYGAILCITGNITKRPVMPGGCSGWQPALSAMMWYVSIISVDSMLIMRFPMGNPLRSTVTGNRVRDTIFSVP